MEEEKEWVKVSQTLKAAGEVLKTEKVTQPSLSYKVAERYLRINPTKSSMFLIAREHQPPPQITIFGGIVPPVKQNIGGVIFNKARRSSGHLPTLRHKTQYLRYWQKPPRYSPGASRPISIVRHPAGT